MRQEGEKLRVAILRVGRGREGGVPTAVPTRQREEGERAGDAPPVLLHAALC